MCPLRTFRGERRKLTKFVFKKYTFHTVVLVNVIKTEKKLS